MGHMPLDPQDYVVNRNKQLGYLVDLDKKHLTEQYAGAVANYNGFITQVGTDPAAHGYPRPAVPMGPSLSPPDPKSGLMSILENSAPVCDPQKHRDENEIANEGEYTQPFAANNRLWQHERTKQAFHAHRF